MPIVNKQLACEPRRGEPSGTLSVFCVGSFAIEMKMNRRVLTRLHWRLAKRSHHSGFLFWGSVFVEWLRMLLRWR